MHDISCFNAHPDYYQPTGPGDYAWSTPSSRVGEAVGPFFLIAWPVAVAGALISMLSLATGAARRRIAIAGLVVGSAVAIFQVLLELGIMFGGGGE